MTQQERFNLRYSCGHIYAPYHNQKEYTAPFKDYPAKCPHCLQEAHYKAMMSYKLGRGIRHDNREQR